MPEWTRKNSLTKRHDEEFVQVTTSSFGLILAEISPDILCVSLSLPFAQEGCGKGLLPSPLLPSTSSMLQIFLFLRHRSPLLLLLRQAWRGCVLILNATHYYCDKEDLPPLLFDKIQER